VEVYYRIKFPETEGSKVVPRHTPPDQLTEIPQIKSISENSGRVITVSPAKSASSETEVCIETSFIDVVQRIKNDLSKEITAKMESMEENFRKTHVAKKEVEYVVFVAKYASLRSIEDWCLNRMKTIAGLPAQSTHRETVESFLKSYKPIDTPTEYIKSLKSSSVRALAVDAIHVKPEDEDNVRRMWSSLETQLSEDEIKKYKALLDFGRGVSRVRFIG
jgi:DNA-directed RNA polymerase subunit F